MGSARLFAKSEGGSARTRDAHSARLVGEKSTMRASPVHATVFNLLGVPEGPRSREPASRPKTRGTQALDAQTPPDLPPFKQSTLEKGGDMEHEGSSAALAKGLVFSFAVAAMLLLSSCAAASSGELPASHLTGDGSIDIGHARCGACHMDAQRDEIENAGLE